MNAAHTVAAVMVLVAALALTCWALVALAILDTRIRRRKSAAR